MRREFHPLLLEYMKRDDKIYVITADLGYKMFDEIAKQFPDRFYNVGASEQLMLGVGIGLAQEGKIPICYSITPFLIKRPFEWIDNYIDHENCPVKLVGGGRDKDYKEDGYSHDASKDLEFLYSFKNIVQFRPNSIEELTGVLSEFLYNKKPSYLNLKR